MRQTRTNSSCLWTTETRALEVVKLSEMGKNDEHV